jgi:DNA repair exonuclease SbcCD ATPase subunit
MNYHEVLMQYKNLQIQLDKNKYFINNTHKKLVLLSDVKQLLMDFSENTRDVIKHKLESLVNSALKCIFTDKQIIFKIQINRTKKIIFYDMYIETDGTITPLFDAKGGGVLDIVTMALRISFVRMFSATLRQTVILDEPFKNLDNERLILAIEWLSQISKELEIQFIIVTHEESIVERSKKIFQFTLTNGVTHVEEQTTDITRDLRKTQDSQTV